MNARPLSGSILRASLFSAAAAALATIGALYLQSQATERETAMLRRENERLRTQALQREAAARASSVAAAQREVDIAPSHGVASAPPPPSAPTPLYRNEGRATPRAALQTFAWACDQGDATLVGGLIEFDRGARMKAEAWWAGAPDAQAQWRSLDEMAAALLTFAGMSRPFPDAELLENVPMAELGKDRVRLSVPGREPIEFQRAADGWRHAITEAMVDQFIQRRGG